MAKRERPSTITLWRLDLKQSTAKCTLRKDGPVYQLELFQDAEVVAEERFADEADALDWAERLRDRMVKRAR